MAYTQAQLDAIRAAIAKGERTVMYGDRSVTYRSMDELLAAEARIARALTEAAGTRSKQTLLVSAKGF